MRPATQQPQVPDTAPWLIRAVRRVGVRDVLILGVAIGVLAGGYTEPSTVRLDDQCNLRGWADRMRASVQGRGFWVNELRLLDREVEHALTFRAEAGRFAADIAEKTAPIFAESQARIESVYARVPHLRPSPNEEAADRLRDLADSLERAADMDKVETALVRHARNLLACRDRLEKRAGSRSRD